MALFISSTTNKVDRKGRVSIPATFRRVLEREETPGVVLAPSVEKLPVLDGFGYGRLETLARQIGSLNQLDPVFKAMSNSVLARSQHLPIDSDGRIVLPPTMLEYARIEGEALFAGLGKQFQIWNPAVYEEQQETFREIAEANFHMLPPETLE